VDRSLNAAAEELSRQRTALVRALARAREVRDGADESGTITIFLDDDGTARDVYVASDWRRRLRPEAVGPALIAADTDAAQRRAVATAEAMAHPSVEDDDASTEDSGPAWSGWLLPVDPWPGEDAGQARSFSELSAAVWAAVDDLDRVTAQPSPVLGSGGSGAVRVTMAQGRVTACAVDQRWLARQDELTLAHALREAVCAAAAASVAARRPLIEYQQRLEALVADAKATLGATGRGGLR
jgi:hypothetical protein